MARLALRARALAAIALALGCAMAAAPACAPVADERGPRRVYANRLPSGAGETIAAERCLTCHSATLLTQQHKDSTAWAKTVAQMEKWGAIVSDSERDSLLAYLDHKPGGP